MCPKCRAGWHGECAAPVKLEAENSSGENEVVYYSCCCYHSKDDPFIETPGEAVFELVVDTRTAQRAEKDPASIRDQTSTGRKRAALLYPIPQEGQLCEWAGLVNAGGGVHPIVGCRGTIIFPEKGNDARRVPGAIHHGPDKSTLNNEPNNVSRVCVTCHNRWHALNNRFYGERPDQGQPFLPLSGNVLPLVRRGLQKDDELVLATDAQFQWSDMYWSLPDKRRKSLPYEPENVHE